MNTFFKDFKRYLPYSIYSAKSSLKSDIADSYLNWVWWILEPLCYMLIYSFVFGIVFGSKEEYHSLFVFIGVTIWTFFSKCIKSSVSLIRKNKSIVQKLYVPKWVFILSKMFENTFKLLVNCGIIIVMLIVYKVPIKLNLILLVIPLTILLFIFTFGLMCILSNSGVYFNDLNNLVDILLKLLIYFTGIPYNIETKIGKHYPVLANVLAVYNPIAFIVIGARKVVLYEECFDLRVYVIWLFVSIVITVIGVNKIYKNENNYVKSI